MYTMCNSTTFALRHTQISLSGILRRFRPPSRHLLLHTHDTNMEFLQLSGPLLDIFLFFSKTKIFHSHPCGMDEDSKGQRKMEDSGGGLLPAVKGHSLE